MDWDAERLLEGLDGPGRDARRALLDELHAEGVPLDELKRAVAENRLVLLPIELALLPAPRLTLSQAAAAAGVPRDRLAEIWRAMGFPVPDGEERAYSDADVEAADRLKTYLEAGMDPDHVLGVLRVNSSSLARCAEVTRDAFARSFLEPGDTELDLARRYRAMAQALMPLVAQDLEYLMRLHLRNFARQDALGLAEVSSGRLAETHEVAVAFADLVGFTELGEQVPESDLGLIADRLTEMAVERVRAPVRLVKTIGDAVMLVSQQPAPLVDLLLDLVDAVEAEDGLPPLRAGAAWGSAFPRLGDWYGATVNLASRVTGRARPGSVLVTPPLRDALDGELERYVWSQAGFKRLKGLAEPVPVWRVRKPQAQS